MCYALDELFIDGVDEFAIDVESGIDCNRALIQVSVKDVVERSGHCGAST